MKVNPRKSHETKQDWFGKRGWSLHTILVIRNLEDDNSQLNIQAFDHWSDDTAQNA